MSTASSSTPSMRHQKDSDGARLGPGAPAMRRLTRKGGSKRATRGALNAGIEVTSEITEDIVRGAMIAMESGAHCTVTRDAVKFALEQMGGPLI